MRTGWKKLFPDRDGDDRGAREQQHISVQDSLSTSTSHQTGVGVVQHSRQYLGAAFRPFSSVTAPPLFDDHHRAEQSKDCA